MNRWIRIRCATVAAGIVLLLTPSGANAQRPVHRIPEADLKQPVIWGSVCQTPAGTAVAFGGQDQFAADGHPHTRIQQDGQWQAIHDRLRARNPLQPFHERCRELVRKQRGLTALARQTYFQGRSRDEQAQRLRRDVLPAERQTLESLGRLVNDLEQAASGLPAYEARQARQAARRLADTRRRFETLVAALEDLTAATIRDLAYVAVQWELAAEAMDAEPPPRALSPLVFDPRSDRIVLFGGDHLDYLTNDTWVFDPVGWKWEQRQPAGAPPPRANHRLTATDDGCVQLEGGYVYTSSTDYCGAQYQDCGAGAWSYDVAANAWSGPGQLEPPDTRVYRTGPFHPDFFLQGQRPDAAATAAALRDLPANTWVEQKPPWRPELDRVWGTAVLDAERDQILIFNGGHSSHGGSDVLHYHLGTNRWELPFPVEFPLGQLYSNTSYPEGFNLNRRPWVTGHTYQSYGFDPLVRKLFFTGQQRDCFVYDPEAGDWIGRFAKPAGMVYNDCFYTLTLCATPRGLVTWTAHGRLFRLDAAASEWVELETGGSKLPGAVVDSSTMVYDSRRDRLLFFQADYLQPHSGEVSEYDAQHGTVRPLAVANQAALAACNLRSLDRACYLPEADLVLFANLLPATAGGRQRSLAFDAAHDRWVSLDIRYELDNGNRPAIPLGSGHSCGLLVDAARRLLWGVNTLDRRVYALRLDLPSADVKPL